jgi:short-subunit dehydrogenase
MQQDDMFQKSLISKRFDGKSFWIIGATSGIGCALAKEMNTRGARIIISGRRSHILNNLQQQLGREAMSLPLDVRDSEAVLLAFQAIEQKFKLDGIIYMAGVFTPMKIRTLDLAEATSIIATNFTGALHVVRAALPSFLARKNGQIALCASIVGYRGLPHAQPYGASKAALINFAESLRAESIKKGVDIKVINPGFVRTPITDKNNFRMPALIDAKEAAHVIANELHSKCFEIHFPKRFTLIMKLLRLIPDWLYFSIMAR